ncbi:alpha/beta fold hydrolase [Streptomyces sp. NPDC052101]|uniref:thioesterase II family protein n=1 Tax=Streptomyces sp. NPDC052101 TaxID=3155763 RepID=UPI00343F0E64
MCFPHAGGSASYFYGVSAALSPALDVLAIQYPGRQDRRSEPVLRTIDELAQQAVDALRPWSDRPLVLFGHSMGALISFEVARKLEAESAGPLSLVVSGCRAPSRYRQDPLHLSSDDVLLAEIERLEGTDSRLMDDEELRALFLPALRGDYEAVATYRHRPGNPLNCPVLAMVGDKDPKAGVDDVDAWRDHTRESCETRVFTGGHFYLTSHAAAVTETVRRHVEELSS